MFSLKGLAKLLFVTENNRDLSSAPQPKQKVVEAKLNRAEITLEWSFHAGKSDADVYWTFE